jgi:hypothetical protein
MQHHWPKRSPAFFLLALLGRASACDDGDTPMQTSVSSVDEPLDAGSGASHEGHFPALGQAEYPAA